METRVEDSGMNGRPTLASSWDTANGDLSRSLLLTRAGVGPQDFDWEELLAPPASGQPLVSLSAGPGPRGRTPCFLDLRCDPGAGEDILAVGVLSSARNMEVYVGEEYCGTGRGQGARTVPEGREQENVIFYKKHLKLETSTYACKIKLLSFGEKQCVFLSKVVVHMKPVSGNSSPSSPALGSRIDLDKVQTIMESMGSKLSPGAQQLMNMVRFQQQVSSNVFLST
uniref:ATPase PAAT n=1 Tax=Ictidomys tridecemlineatus TaxID=43179 RepID=UPI001A9DF0C7|nr:ATPase PAAT [Ictidomys tridecemlineatus]